MISNSSKADFKMIVDADSCPVKNVIIRIAGEEKIEVLMVASVAHQVKTDAAYVRVLSVDNMPQAADIAIANNVVSGDIVITSDYGLASLVLSKGADCLSPRGVIFTHKNIDRFLAERHISSKVRQSGGRVKGPKALADKDIRKFEINLRRIISDKKSVIK